MNFNLSLILCTSLMRSFTQEFVIISTPIYLALAPVLGNLIHLVDLFANCFPVTIKVDGNQVFLTNGIAELTAFHKLFDLVKLSFDYVVDNFFNIRIFYQDMVEIAYVHHLPPEVINLVSDCDKEPDLPAAAEAIAEHLSILLGKLN